MLRSEQARTPFLLFTPPYRNFVPLPAPRQFLREGAGLKGSAIIWRLASGISRIDEEVAKRRPAGVVLIIILPPASSLSPEMDLLGIIGRCRPSAILPYHEDLAPDDMTALLRRPPSDLPAEFTDYLAWRGIHIDRDTRRIIRRTVALSKKINTIAALSRAVYLSRRALGRRFVSRGLPVPSHWLQFARLLRAVVQLQNSASSLHTVACALGYPDGYALSNQMSRMAGVRPSIARECLGWEWIAECWLQKEKSNGALIRGLREKNLNDLPLPPPGTRPGLPLRAEPAPVSLHSRVGLGDDVSKHHLRPR